MDFREAWVFDKQVVIIWTELQDRKDEPRESAEATLIRTQIYGINHLFIFHLEGFQ